MKTATSPSAHPWYREPWPWIFMAGPFIVIVACIVTAWIAAESNDGLIVEDYYTRGIEINQTLAREHLAATLGVRMRVTFGDDGRQVRIDLTENGNTPESLVMHVVHPTRSGMDQDLTLRASSPGVYEAQLAQPVDGRRALIIEDGTGTWRLSGQSMTVGANSVVTLGAAAGSS